MSIGGGGGTFRRGRDLQQQWQTRRGDRGERCFRCFEALIKCDCCGSWMAPTGPVWKIERWMETGGKKVEWRRLSWKKIVSFLHSIHYAICFRINWLKFSKEVLSLDSSLMLPKFNTTKDILSNLINGFQTFTCCKGARLQYSPL